MKYRRQRWMWWTYRIEGCHVAWYARQLGSAPIQANGEKGPRGRVLRPERRFFRAGHASCRGKDDQGHVLLDSLGLFFFLQKKNRIPKEREREREKRPVAGFEGVDGDWTAVTSSLTCKQAPRQTQAPAPPASPKQLVEQRSFQVRNSVKLGKTR